MPAEEDLYMNGVGRAQSVYQQPSTGEKHVLFYPTSPAPSVNSEERRSWSQASSSFVNAHVRPFLKQSKYNVNLHHVDVEFFDKKFFKRIDLQNTEYNRTIRTIDAYAETLFIVDNKVQITLEVYKFIDNIYKLYAPIRVTIPCCEFIDINVAGIQDILKANNINGICPFEQGNTTASKLSNNNSEKSRMKKTENSASEPPDAGGSSQSQHSSCDSRYNFKIGIYGWRKRCLYVLILGLLVMVIVNLALTLWVLKVMEFSSEGMGQLKIVSGGLRLEGTAYVLDSLIASSIRSRSGEPIVIESSRNLTLTTRDENGLLDNLIYLGNDRFECLANNFKVMDDRGIVLFSANNQEVVIGSDTLRVTGEGGAMFSGSIQTPLVRAESGHDLRLESPTRSLEMRAPSGISIESRAGDIKSMALNDIKLKSVEGAIRLDSSVILMDKIPTAIPSTKPSQSKNHDIYQLCICNNGKLFLVPPHYLCSDDGIICR